MYNARHRMVTRLIEEHRPHRNFPDWSMGFHKATMAEIRKVKDFTQIRDVQDFMNTVQNSPEKSHVLLRTFYESNLRS